MEVEIYEMRNEKYSDTKEKFKDIILTNYANTFKNMKENGDFPGEHGY